MNKRQTINKALLAINLAERTLRRHGAFEGAETMVVGQLHAQCVAIQRDLTRLRNLRGDNQPCTDEADLEEEAKEVPAPNFYCKHEKLINGVYFCGFDKGRPAVASCEGRRERGDCPKPVSNDPEPEQPTEEPCESVTVSPAIDGGDPSSIPVMEGGDGSDWPKVGKLGYDTSKEPTPEVKTPDCRFRSVDYCEVYCCYRDTSADIRKSCMGIWLAGKCPFKPAADQLTLPPTTVTSEQPKPEVTERTMKCEWNTDGTCCNPSCPGDLTNCIKLFIRGRCPMDSAARQKVRADSNVKQPTPEVKPLEWKEGNSAGERRAESVTHGTKVRYGIQSFRYKWVAYLNGSRIASGTLQECIAACDKHEAAQ